MESWWQEGEGQARMLSFLRWRLSGSTLEAPYGSEESMVVFDSLDDTERRKLVALAFPDPDQLIARLRELKVQEPLCLDVVRETYWLIRVPKRGTEERSRAIDMFKKVTGHGLLDTMAAFEVVERNEFVQLKVDFETLAPLTLITGVVVEVKGLGAL